MTKRTQDKLKDIVKELEWIAQVGDKNGKPTKEIQAKIWEAARILQEAIPPFDL